MTKADKSIKTSLNRRRSIMASDQECGLDMEQNN